MKFLLTGLFFLLVCSCSLKEKKATVRTAPDIPSAWLMIEKDDYIIHYPQTWERQSRSEGVEFQLFSPITSSADKLRDNVNLVIVNLFAKMSLERYVALEEKNLKDKFSISVTGKNKYSVDGQVYYQLNMRWKDGNCLTQHFYLKEKTAYILSFTYNPDEMDYMLSEGEKILASFKVK